jgi:hypothetical protein
MTFRDADGPLTRIQLQQVLGADGKRGRLFQLAAPFEFVDGTEVFPVRAHDPSRPPVSIVAGREVVDNGTDLASVPTVFWALIAPYGRQSAAAILHDQQTAESDRIADPAARIAARVDIDLRFRRALRSQGVPRLRSHLMWAFVSLQSYFDPAPWRARAMLTAIATSVLAVWALIVGLALAPSPWWPSLLGVPALTLMVFWRVRVLIGTLLLTGVGLGWLMLLQVVIVVVFRAVEWLTSPGDDVATPTIARYRIR